MGDPKDSTALLPMSETLDESIIDAAVARAQENLKTRSFRDHYNEGFRLGCIVGAAIVAWGEAMRATYPCTLWGHRWVAHLSPELEGCMRCGTQQGPGAAVEALREMLNDDVEPFV